MVYLYTIVRDPLENEGIILADRLFAAKHPYSDQQLAEFQKVASCWELKKQNDLDFIEYYDDSTCFIQFPTEAYIVKDNELFGFFYDGYYFQLDEPSTHYYYNTKPGLYRVGGYYGGIEYALLYFPEDEVLLSEDGTVFRSCPRNQRGVFCVPEGVVTIAERAFYGCKYLEEVYIPAGVKEILRQAFRGCSGLTKVVIDDSVSEIHHEAFEDCPNVRSFSIPAEINWPRYIQSDVSEYLVTEANRYFSAVDGVLFNKNRTTLCRYPCGKNETEYVVPEGVVEIAQCAFYCNKQITCVKLPNSIQAINYKAFAGCSALKKIILPAKQIKYGKRVFDDCPQLNMED